MASVDHSRENVIMKGRASQARSGKLEVGREREIQSHQVRKAKMLRAKI